MIKSLKRLIILVILIVVAVSIFDNFDYIRDKLLTRIYKLDYSEYVEKYSKEYDVDKYLIYAIIKAESNFKKEAVSNKGAKGLMQLMDSTAMEVAGQININLDEDDILAPKININLGTKYISILIQKYNNINLALTAYNAGSGNVDNWINEGILKSDGSDIEKVPFTETNNYVRKILRDYKIYNSLYD